MGGHAAGVDYGLRRVAIAVPSAGILVDVDRAVRGKPCDALDALEVLADTYCNAVIRTRVELVAIEAPIVGMSRNVRTGLQLGMVAGALSSAALRTGSKVIIVEPSTWKKAIVGNGNANKDDVSDYLARKHPRLHERTATQDAIDATCLALYAMERLVA